MAKVTVERTSPDDVLEFMGGPPPHRIFAMTMREEGRIIAIGGFAYVGNCIVGFMDAKPRARKYPIALHKAALKIMQEARARGYRSIATLADMEVSPAAERWLVRLGFAPNEDGTHRWLN